MVDVNKPVENPDFVSALDAYRAEPNAQTEAEFLRRIRTAHFLAPVDIAPPIDSEPKPDGSVVLEKDTHIRFFLISSQDGKNYFPAFTDWGALREWSSQPPRRTLDDYSAMLRQDENADGVAINPFGQNLVLSPKALAWINGEAVPITAQSGSNILVGEPDEPYCDLTDAASSFFVQHTGVKQAFLRKTVREDTASLLMIVDFERENERELFNGVAAALRELLNGRLLDLIAYSSEFGTAAAKDCKPFYERKN